MSSDRSRQPRPTPANQRTMRSNPSASCWSNAFRRSESMSSTATSAPLALNTGTTISDFDRASHVMCPGKRSTSGTIDRPALGGGGAAHAPPERNVEAAKRALIRPDEQEARRNHAIEPSP